MGKVRIFANSPQKLDSQHYSDLQRCGCYYSNGFVLKFRIYEFEYLAAKLHVIFVKFVQRQCGCIKAGY